MAIYNKYSWDKLAHVFCNAIDSNIPKDVTEVTTSIEKGYIVTTYLPRSSADYDGVDIKFVS